MDDLERDLIAGSQAEHLTTEGCWCRHPRSEHRWDAVRDYRELECLACKGGGELRGGVNGSGV
jgi:hypothetical protein